MKVFVLEIVGSLRVMSEGSTSPQSIEGVAAALLRSLYKALPAEA